MLVGWAMSTFGIVVEGVGTMHAPYAAWGVAATLQKLGAFTNVAYFVVAGGAGLATAIYAHRR